MRVDRSEIFREYYPNRVQDLTKEQLLSLYKEIVEMLENDNLNLGAKLATASDPELEQLEMSTLNIYLQVCSALEEKHQFDEFENLSDKVMETYPCDVYFNQELGCYLIDTPTVLGSYRTYGETEQQHLIANLVSIALKQFEAREGIDLLGSIQSPYCIYLIRRVRPTQTSNTIPDIDNVGARHLINALARNFALSDSFKNLTWSCNTIEYIEGEGETLGTSIVIIGESSKMKYEQMFMDYNHSNNFLRN